jgi:hypothetical protein
VSSSTEAIGSASCSSTACKVTPCMLPNCRHGFFMSRTHHNLAQTVLYSVSKGSAVLYQSCLQNGHCWMSPEQEACVCTCAHWVYTRTRNTCGVNSYELLTVPLHAQHTPTTSAMQQLGQLVHVTPAIPTLHLRCQLIWNLRSSSSRSSSTFKHSPSGSDPVQHHQQCSP